MCFTDCSSGKRPDSAIESHQHRMLKNREHILIPLESERISALSTFCAKDLERTSASSMKFLQCWKMIAEKRFCWSLALLEPLIRIPGSTRFNRQGGSGRLALLHAHGAAKKRIRRRWHA